MRKNLIVLNLIIIQFFFLSCNKKNDKKYIFFYKPYTDSSETNVYEKAELKFDYNTQYKNIKNADVKNEVNNAIKHNDYRFIAISGNSYLYPGLEDGEMTEKYIRKYKVKVIKGTSDAISMGLPPLQRIAYDYAQKYNKILLMRIKELEKKTQ